MLVYQRVAALIFNLVTPVLEHPPRAAWDRHKHLRQFSTMKPPTKGDDHHIIVEIAIPLTQLTKTLRICHRYSKIAVQPPVLTGVMLVGWRVQLLSV